MNEVMTELRDEAGAIDVAGLRNAFGRFPSGVTALSAYGPEDEPVGMAVSAFTSVSIDPPLVGVCVQRSSTTWPRLRALPRIGLSVLGASQGEACRRLATRGTDRFVDLTWHTTDERAILLHGAAAWLDCSVEAEVPAGDHEFVLLRIHRQQIHPGNPPLVFFASAFHELGALDHAS
ncbi:flavin reductase family protein [Gordonia sp. Z-3]|uniref:flavin reductase family protein n=1 Tax=Gordonia sp. Z-3 TaxID=3115408 RepID=UPI002E291F2A|nr:flavin reductase family protein [Gordonia sp. Z-3]MED5803832.1 flavin reductase family protein [Gordonia sp. Z-3]